MAALERTNLRITKPVNTSVLSSLDQRSKIKTRSKNKDQITLGMADAVKWLLCLLSLTVCNISCVALVSFFLTTLPTKRNLFTFFDTVLVVALTSDVDITVRVTSKDTREISPILSVLPSYASKHLETHRPLWWQS